MAASCGLLPESSAIPGLCGGCPSSPRDNRQLGLARPPGRTSAQAQQPPHLPRATRGLPRPDRGLSREFPAIVRAGAGSGSCAPQTGPDEAGVGLGTSWLRVQLASPGLGWWPVTAVPTPTLRADPHAWVPAQTELSLGLGWGLPAPPHSPGKHTGSPSFGHTWVQVGHAEQVPRVMGYWQRTHQELGRLGTLAQSTMLTWGHSNPRMGDGWGAQETQRASAGCVGTCILTPAPPCAWWPGGHLAPLNLFPLAQ